MTADRDLHALVPVHVRMFDDALRGALAQIGADFEYPIGASFIVIERMMAIISDLRARGITVMPQPWIVWRGASA